jgi:hypothetical protein
MKYLKLFESFNKEYIDAICRKYDITNYKINEDGTIDVDGDVDLTSRINSERLPLKFSNVTGDFWCDDNQLTSLEGCPKSVGGSFYCDVNKLTSLEGCPKSVGGSFHCDVNRLTSLEGCPKSVVDSFYCFSNKLTSLEGCSESVGGNFWCYNNKLTSLEGCPKSVGGEFKLTYLGHNNPCSLIYEEWIDTDRRDELLDMMKDYDFLRGETINWYLLEAFFNDAGLEIPNKEGLQKYYTIED